MEKIVYSSCPIKLEQEPDEILSFPLKSQKCHGMRQYKKQNGLAQIKFELQIMEYQNILLFFLPIEFTFRRLQFIYRLCMLSYLCQRCLEKCFIWSNWNGVYWSFIYHYMPQSKWTKTEPVTQKTLHK